MIDPWLEANVAGVVVVDIGIEFYKSSSIPLLSVVAILMIVKGFDEGALRTPVRVATIVPPDGKYEILL